MTGALLPNRRIFRLYGLDEQKLAYAHPDAIVMHPGPINRGVEIASEVADGPQSVILNQVTNGIAVRMAVMAMAMSGQIVSKRAAQMNKHLITHAEVYCTETKRLQRQTCF